MKLIGLLIVEILDLKRENNTGFIYWMLTKCLLYINDYIIPQVTNIYDIVVCVFFLLSKGTGTSDSI